MTATEIQIYTDGSCINNPGPGGWAFIITDQDGNTLLSDAGGETHTTNNQMEMWAVHRALNTLENGRLFHALPPDVPAVLFSDSEYVINGLTKWRANWEAKGMKNGKNKPVKNVTLWKILYDQADKVSDVSFQWVRGHANNPFNETVDTLAQAESGKMKVGIGKPSGPAGLIQLYEKLEQEEAENIRLALSSANAAA